MGQWRDTTSYRRDERKTGAAREWRLEFPGGELIVHRRVIDPGAWYVSCNALDIDAVFLCQGCLAEEAQEEALCHARRVAIALAYHLSALEGGPGLTR